MVVDDGAIAADCPSMLAQADTPATDNDTTKTRDNLFMIDLLLAETVNCCEATGAARVRNIQTRSGIRRWSRVTSACRRFPTSGAATARLSDCNDQVIVPSSART